MRESRSLGSVRGAVSNDRPYREHHAVLFGPLQILLYEDFRTLVISALMRPPLNIEDHLGPGPRHRAAEQHLTSLARRDWRE